MAQSKELLSLRERNAQLVTEVENLRHQVRTQDEAILGAHELQGKTDRMLVDFDKCREELEFYKSKNEDLLSNLQINLNGRRRAEDDLLALNKEYEDFKTQARDREGRDSNEINIWQERTREIQGRYDATEAERARLAEQLEKAMRELDHWQEAADKAQQDNKLKQSQIDELEIQKKLLGDKLNNQIYQQAASYKQKTMNALMGRKEPNEAPTFYNDAGSPMQTVSPRVPPRGAESTFARSPLRTREANI